MLIVFFGCFVATLVLDKWVFVAPTVENLLALAPLDSRHSGWEALWQLATFPLVVPDGAVFGALISWLFFWLVVSPFEERYGARRTLQLAIVATLFAGVAALLASTVVPDHFTSPLYGPGPVIWSAIAAYCWSLRRHNPTIMVFGVLPMTVRQLLIALVALPFLFFLASKNASNLAGDLGAMVGGIVFINWITKPRGRKKPPSRGRKRPKKDIPFTVIEGGQKGEDERPRWLN